MTELRAPHPDEMMAAISDVELAFGGSSHEADTALDLALLDPARCLVVIENGRAVSTAGSFDFDMTVPGANLPVAGVSWVSVAPTHRRRGLLTAAMDRQLGDLHAGGTAVAALWASEGAIYQRFGYGPAAWGASLELARGAAFTRPVDVAGLQLVDPTAAQLAPAYQGLARLTPGWWARDDAWWTYRLHDPEHRREGASPLRCVVDGADGYALYATKPAWGDAGPEGLVGVREVVAGNPESWARLWRYLLDQDLMRTVKAWGRPVDDPVLQLLAEPRTARLSVALWVRLVSVPAALAGRCYASPVDVVLEVADSQCPWNAGRWRLSGDSAGATCTATTDRADLVLPTRELGAAYLGGTPLATRARAGWVQEQTRGALAAASTAFGWAGPVASSPMVF